MDLKRTSVDLLWSTRTTLGIVGLAEGSLKLSTVNQRLQFFDLDLLRRIQENDDIFDMTSGIRATTSRSAFVSQCEIEDEVANMYPWRIGRTVNHLEQSLSTGPC